jgi:hypothetical protein
VEKQGIGGVGKLTNTTLVRYKTKTVALMVKSKKEEKKIIKAMFLQQ